MVNQIDGAEYLNRIAKIVGIRNFHIETKQAEINGTINTYFHR